MANLPLPKPVPPAPPTTAVSAPNAGVIPQASSVTVSPKPATPMAPVAPVITPVSPPVMKPPAPSVVQPTAVQPSVVRPATPPPPTPAPPPAPPVTPTTTPGRTAALSVAPPIPSAPVSTVPSSTIAKLPVAPPSPATTTPTAVPASAANATPTPPSPTMTPTIARPPQTMTALSSASANTLPASVGVAGPPPPPPSTPSSQVEYAKPKTSIFKYLPLVVGGLLILMVAAFGVMWFMNRGGSGSSSTTGSSSETDGTAGTSGTSGTADSTAGQQIVLQYWGLWEPSETFQQVIADFQKNTPGVSVQYVKQSHKDYRTRVQNAVNSGNGPDIFRFHAAWVPMLKNELAPLPSAVMSSSEYQKTFYPVAASQLQVNGTPVGIPLMYEGLALFYNVDLLNTAVVQPPKTWSEVQAAARTLTVLEGGEVVRGGIAMGNSTNVEHFSDIVALLMHQNGADFTNPNSPETRDALLFYTKFMKDNLWSDSLPSSSVAFARGDVAMIFAPSWRAHEIKQMNPSLNFATVTVPQLSGEEKSSWANFWAEGVSLKGKHQKEAWQFLKYLSTKEVQQKLAASQAETRSFGEIYSRVDLADSLAADPVVGSFVIDAPKAVGWYMSSSTHDGGINDEIIAYYADAVSSMLTESDSAKILQTLDAGVKQVLQRYGISSSGATGSTGSTTTSTNQAI